MIYYFSFLANLIRKRTFGGSQRGGSYGYSDNRSYHSGAFRGRGGGYTFGFRGGRGGGQTFTPGFRGRGRGRGRGGYNNYNNYEENQSEAGSEVSRGRGRGFGKYRSKFDNVEPRDNQNNQNNQIN
jgi:hypothetical protein